jgi:hypothetical protein
VSKRYDDPYLVHFHTFFSYANTEEAIK